VGFHDCMHAKHFLQCQSRQRLSDSGVIWRHKPSCEPISLITCEPISLIKNNRWNQNGDSQQLFHVAIFKGASQLVTHGVLVVL
jgi:hypothetical protein